MRTALSLFILAISSKAWQNVSQTVLSFYPSWQFVLSLQSRRGHLGWQNGWTVLGDLRVGHSVLGRKTLCHSATGRMEIRLLPEDTDCRCYYLWSAALAFSSRGGNPQPHLPGQLTAIWKKEKLILKVTVLVWFVFLFLFQEVFTMEIINIT